MSSDAYKRLRPEYAALTNYDQRRDPRDHKLDKVLPSEPGIVHALPTFKLRNREPQFLDSWEYRRARCGAIVKVILPVLFDPGDADSCQRCAIHSHNETYAPRENE